MSKSSPFSHFSSPKLVMDILDFNKLKSRKSNIRIIHFNHLRKIQKLFRLAEFCLCIVLVSCTSSRLPTAVKISGYFFRRILSVIVSPVSVFIISNAIVLTLLFKSGYLSTQSAVTLTSNVDDIYKEYFVGNRGSIKDLKIVENNEEIVYDNKEIIYEDNNKYIMDVDDTFGKQFRRSKSEKFEEGILVKGCKELRRSKTEKGGKLEYEVSPEVEEEVYVFDNLSNEEFQKAIEEFIAKQVKFHEEEKMAIVLHSQP